MMNSTTLKERLRPIFESKNTFLLVIFFNQLHEEALENKMDDSKVKYLMLYVTKELHKELPESKNWAGENWYMELAINISWRNSKDNAEKRASLRRYCRKKNIPLEQLLKHQCPVVHEIITTLEDED